MFVKVDLGIGMGSMVTREYDVTATPTFDFSQMGRRYVLLGNQISHLWLRSACAQIYELKGVNAPELCA